MILVDGLNLAYWCGEPPQLRLPLTLLGALLARGDRALLCFDASTPYRISADDRRVYDELVGHASLLVPVPSGTPADRVMLRHARMHEGRIVTRDKFADHRKRYRKLVDDPSRLLPGFVAKDRLQVPALGVDAALPATSREAWMHLRAYD